MGELRIEVTVTGGADFSDMLDELAGEGGGDGTHLVVRRRPNCCDKCLMNEDPRRIPMHVLCHCWVEIERDDHEHEHE